MAMLIETKSKVFEPMNDSGEKVLGTVAGAKLVENIATKFGLKTKIYFKIYTAELDSEGNNKTALFSANANLHEKSDLRWFLSKLMAFDVGENFDAERAIGVSALFVFENNASKTDPKKVFSNIIGIYPTTKKLAVPTDFVAFRNKDEEAATPAPARQRQVATVIPDEPNGAVAEI